MTAALLIVLVGIYTNIAVPFGETFVPGVMALVGCVLLVAARPRYIQQGPVGVLALLILFLLVSTLLGDANYLTERLYSFVQMAAALVTMHVTLQAYADTERKTLSVMFGGFAAFMVAGCTAEFLLPFVRDISDAFREWAYAGRFLYDFDERDLSVYGAVRANWFTQEPSHVAKAFLACGTAWYLLSEHRFRLWLLIGASVILTLFLRSPFVLLVVPVALGLDVMKQGPRHAVIAAVAVLPVLCIMAAIGAQVFSTRLGLAARGEDFSFFMRFVGPYDVAGLALQDHPIFGVGLGGKETLYPYIREAFQGWTSNRYLDEIYQSALANAAANSLSFFGLVGAPIFYGLLIAYFRKALVPLAVVLLFFQLDGALEGVRMWSFVAVVIGAYAKVSHAPAPKRRRRKRRKGLAAAIS